MFVVEITRYRTLPSESQRSEHLSYIRSKAEEGKVVIAGRFADLRGGMVVWRVGSLEEARLLAESDPYRVAGLIDYDLREWNISMIHAENAR